MVSLSYRGEPMLNIDEKEDAIKRLNRIEGQVRGIVKMIEEERYCIDILTQTKAIKSAIDKIDGLIMEQHLDRCLSKAIESGDPVEKGKKIDEIMKLFSRLK